MSSLQVQSVLVVLAVPLGYFCLALPGIGFRKTSLAHAVVLCPFLFPSSKCRAGVSLFWTAQGWARWPEEWVLGVLAE